MKKLLAIICSLVHYLCFILLLLVFHVLQVVSFNLFGKKAHKKTVDLLNFLLILNMGTLLSRTTFKGFKDLPRNKPLIIVANHQSMYDIPAVVWAFRKHHVRFISKKELGKNIPSISYNLDKGGSVLIDREKGSDSIKKILELGKVMDKNNYSVCLFPEGTRSKTGEMRKFQPAGFKTLLKTSPNALIVPFVIDGNYKLYKYSNIFPLNIGLHLKYTALEPVAQQGKSAEGLLQLVEERIKNHLRICD